MADIAVIGAGPKGVAVATKAAALSHYPPHPPLNITVFEHDRLAAAWRGGSGYTDGLQPLCTLAERDLGFPYGRTSFGPEVARDMFMYFSWQAFAVREGLDRAQYDQWVLRGRNPPSHAHFAEYLKSAFTMSGALLEPRRVTALDYDASARKWVVDATDVASGHVSRLPFDGVVVTGSGPAFSPLPINTTTHIPTASARVFDGITFWTQLAQVVNILANEHPDDRRVVIIGAGGTAAAIAYWFVRQGVDVPITILGKEATLFARHPGFFEDRLFSEEDDWALLSADSRDEFVSRLTTGVVWDYVLRNLDTAQIKYSCAQVEKLVVLTTPYSGLHPEVFAQVHQPVARGVTWSGPVDNQEGAVFIDARGFDRWDFTRLLPPALQAHFVDRDALQAGVTDALAVGATALPGPFPPGLHVPMLASRQGPAAPNLMALGWLSDRILSHYLPRTVRIRPVTGPAATGP